VIPERQREVAVFSLAYVLESYTTASNTQVTPPIQAEINRMYDLRDEFETRSGIPEPTAFWPEEVLTLRSVLQGVREALLLSTQQGVPLERFGVGEPPSVAEIEELITEFSGVVPA
jgi:hypothetical protein